MINKYFSDREFAAFLFDFDGTVADTMGAHLAAWNKSLAPHGLTLSREQHLAWAGRPTREIVTLLNEINNTNVTYDELAPDKEKYYFGALANVKEIIPVMEIIRHYHGQVPMAIVSGSRHKPVESTLAHLGLTKYFDVLVCAEDYVNGKPAPDCFLKAAKLLNVRPEECLVFEDANLGIEAAHKAGMACLRVNEVPPGGHALAKVEQK